MPIISGISRGLVAFGARTKRRRGTPPVTVDLLIVGGGGGGGRNGGGGGAGGVLFSTAYRLNTDGPTTFTVEIGGGGAGAADGANTTVTSNAPGGTKTGLKGGKGGDQGQYGSGGNGTYGSGGGGGRDTGQNTGPVGQIFTQTGGAGTPGQGYEGGSGTAQPGEYGSAGGGGGYTGRGDDAGRANPDCNTQNSGNGAAGGTINVLLSSLDYGINPFYTSTYGGNGIFALAAGGGGGVQSGPPFCGSASCYGRCNGGGPLGPSPRNRTGGDGAYVGSPAPGGSPVWPGGNAVSYSGSGGGGSGGNGAGGSGAGGRVILRYSDIYDAGFDETGLPIITVANGYRHYDFANTGQITF